MFCQVVNGVCPARLLRMRFVPELVERFLALRWWDFCPSSFNDLDMYDVEGFLTEMEARKAASGLKRFSPNRLTVREGRLVPA